MVKYLSILFNIVAISVVGTIIYIEATRPDHILKGGNYVSIIKD